METGRLDPSFFERLARLPSKVRAHGWTWPFRRLFQEVFEPSTGPGKMVRGVAARIERMFRRGSVRSQGNLLYCFYDLQVCPITYDFAYFLVAAELASREAGCQGFVIVIVPGKSDGLRLEIDDYEAVVDRAKRRWRLDNVVMPMVQLSEACEGLVVCPDRAEAAAIRSRSGERTFPADYSVSFPIALEPYGYVYKRALRPDSFTGLRASKQGLAYVDAWIRRCVPQGLKPVTFTLRQYEFMATRNNSLPNWAAFGRRLLGDGYYPIVVLDTDQAFDGTPDELKDFAVFHEAAWHLPLRMALYESAVMNFFVNNGPMLLCQLNPAAPYMIFKLLVPDCPQASQAFFERRGDPIGRSPAFAGAHQKWVWRPDDADVMYAEFSTLIGRPERDGESAQ